MLGAVVVLLLLGCGGAYVWATSTSSARLEKTYTVHSADFPIPFPLSEAELARLREEKAAGRPAAAEGEAADPLAGVDLDALALERAQARGKHLVESIYPCIECHAADFGGGTMMDAMPVGRLFGMNLTAGKGGVVGSYTAKDWDHLVRHGVKPDGKPTAMPSGDFANMSDRELSDIIAYIKSMPPVDRELPRPELGPVGTFLMAKGDIFLDAERIDHDKAHRRDAPDGTDAMALGEHLSRICTGCHRPDFTGGPIQGGPPDWAPAANITPHADGIAHYTPEDFTTVLRQGKGPGGKALKPPMDAMGKYGQNMSDQEIAAMWTYLRTVPAKPSVKQ